MKYLILGALFLCLGTVASGQQDCRCGSALQSRELDVTRFRLQLKNGSILNNCTSAQRIVDPSNADQRLRVCAGGITKEYPYGEIDALIYEGIGHGSVPVHLHVLPARRFEYAGTLYRPSPFYAEIDLVAGVNVARNYADEPIGFAGARVHAGMYLFKDAVSIGVGPEILGYHGALWFPVTASLRVFLTQSSEEQLADYKFESPGATDGACVFAHPYGSAAAVRNPGQAYREVPAQGSCDSTVLVVNRKIEASTHARWFLSLEGGPIFDKNGALKEKETPDLLNPGDIASSFLVEAGIGCIDGGAFLMKGLVYYLGWRYMPLRHMEATDCPSCLKQLLVKNPINGLTFKLGYQF